MACRDCGEALAALERRIVALEATQAGQRANPIGIDEERRIAVEHLRRQMAEVEQRRQANVYGAPPLGRPIGGHVDNYVENWDGA